MLPPLGHSAYSDHNRRLAKVAMGCAEGNMCATSDRLHELSGVQCDEVLDVCVTSDGTRSKRGFTATYGIMVVIAWETGQVLDFLIRSKRCNACSRKLNKVTEESAEFAAWWETHKDNCEKNHSGSSPSMEAEAALDIWKRSEECLHLRFTEVISDGDHYGENVTITKYECVGHIQKRVGKGLREVKKQVLAANRLVRAGMKEMKEELKEKKLKVKEKEKKWKEKGLEREGKRKGEGSWIWQRQREVGGRCRGRRVESGGGRAEVEGW